MPEMCHERISFHVSLEPGTLFAQHTLDVPLMSKARPRSTAQRTPYMPARYKRWKADVRAQLAEWWIRPPVKEIAVLAFKFKGPARSDLDNLEGSILDAGNKLIWVDDRTSIIKKLWAEHEKAKQDESQIEIRLWYLP